MTTLQQGEGARLLGENAAAEYAGTHPEAVRNWAAMGLLEAVDTPAGVRYRLHEVQAVLSGDWLREAPGRHMSPYHAGQILGVSTGTLRRRAREGCITRLQMPGGQFAYLAAEIRAIRAERERLGKPKWWPEPKTS